MFLFKLIKILFKDLVKALRDKINKVDKPIHLYGIYGYFGLPGKGKTMTMSYILDELRQRYGNKIHIITNYNYIGQDEPFVHWKQLLKDYPKPLVVAWDEVQNEFNSRAFKDFPVELLTLLTQNRKGHGKQIHYTAQRWNRVDKVFRELTFLCGQCNTIFGRWGRVKYYDWEDYEQLCSTTEVQFKMKIRPKTTVNYIQTDELRESYNSYAMLESAKSKEYMSREELSKIKGVV